MKSKGGIIKIGIDLDGVIIGKPPLIPRRLIEWLYRSSTNKKLSYRFPNTKVEVFIRWLSHHPLFRPPIKKNLKFIRELSKDKKYKLYAISSRYSFLQERTRQWFENYSLNGVFEQIFLNIKDEQPHLFKERVLKKLKPQMFIDDDLLTVEYLKAETEKMTVQHLRLKEDELSKLIGQKGWVKALFVLTYYLPHWTGLTQYAARLAESLSQRGHDASVLCVQHKKSLLKKKKLKGVKVYRSFCLFKFIRSLVAPFLLIDLVKLALRNEVVVIYLPFLEALPASIIVKLLRRRLFLIHNGDLVLPKHGGIFSRLVEEVFFASTSLSIKLSDGVVVQTKDYSKKSRLLSKHKDKWKVILPLYDSIRVTKTEVENFKSNNNLFGKKLIGFSGRFVEEKGVDYLLRAIPLVISSVPNTHFVLAGESRILYEKFWENIKHLIDKNKKHITLLGLIRDKREMASFYSSLDALIQPSRTDCFPSSQVEAINLGTPVICTDIPGARWVVRTTKMGLIVRPNSPPALAKGIIKVLKDRRKYTRSKKDIERIFGHEETIRKYEELFKS
jgi:glycosyltransferase involved in cell wall biosynthesis